MSHQLLSSLPDQSANRDPDAVSFRCLGNDLSNQGLATRAAQVAYVLREHGVRPGDLVGVYLRKSLNSAVAIYGIMQAGAVYVPLDPTAPVARLKQVIAQCDIQILVSDLPMQRHLHMLLSEPTSIHCIIGADGGPKVQSVGWEDVACAPSLPLVPRDPTDAAYIMFTSGSTGIPKGIVHTHKSGLAYAKAATRLFDIDASDRMANHSALHFDMSTFAMFGGPLVGACVVIVSDAHARLPAEMTKLIQDERISIWYSVPFALTQMLEHGAIKTRDMSSLRWVIFAGEAMQPKHLRGLMETLPDASFSNNYGPAEVNVCTYHNLTSPAEVPDNGVPIGTIWDAAEGIILDENDAEVPSGSVGELVVTSDTMMREYWKAPALTDQSLYQSPDGSKYYRTRDLVQDIGDGVLILHGRRDRQVKLRGFRVELDEIETVLCQHSAVQEAAAMVSKDGDGLIAAVTLRPGTDIDVEILRDHASAALASYSVPAVFRIMEQFPRTGTEKIDRNAILEQITI